MVCKIAVLTLLNWQGLADKAKNLLSSKKCACGFVSFDMPEEKTKLPFTCPVCGRKEDYPFEALVEGASLTCPFCKLTLTLHGHMLEDVQREIQKLKKKT